MEKVKMASATYLCVLLVCLTCVVRGGAHVLGSYGGLCMNECTLYEGWTSTYYFCRTSSHSWDYCSPVVGTGAYGGVCQQQHPCAGRGYSYTWCYTEEGSWDYCSAQQAPVLGAYGGVCLDECEQRGDSSYSYCKTTTNRWDYCARKPQTGANGAACRADHHCANHWWWYSWCRTQDGSWDYCSIHSADYSSSLTRYGYHCLSPCQLHGTYHYCYDWGNWDYCSPAAHATYRGQRCSSDHDCDTHGYSYYWCDTGKSWDYCSPIENCAYWPNRNLTLAMRKKRSTQTLCEVKDQRNVVLTSFTYDTGVYSSIAVPSIQQHREGELLIGKWQLTSIKGGHQAETLYSSNNLRIDIKEITERGLADIHLQTKGPGTQTLAAILMPTGIPFPLRHVRRAFSESLNRTMVINLKKFPVV